MPQIMGDILRRLKEVGGERWYDELAKEMTSEDRAKLDEALNRKKDEEGDPKDKA
jgi:hypothetical protein